MTTVYELLSVLSTLIALGALVFAVWQRRAFGRNPLSRLIQERYPAVSGRWSQAAFGLVLGSASILLPLLVYMLLGWVHVFWAGWGGLLVLGLGMVTAVSKLLWVFFEELIFRGALLPLLNLRLPAAWALLIAALIFAFGHFSRGSQPPDLLSLAVLLLDGLGFGLLFLASGSLWMPLGWHFSKNLLLWLIYNETSLQFSPGLLRVGFTGPPLWVGAPQQAGLVDVLMTLALVGLTLIIYRGSRRTAAEAGSSAGLNL